MADNPYVNKVIYGSSTLMDITDTTADDADVAEGEVYYKASGLRSAGTAKYAGAAVNHGAANMTAAIPYGECDSTSTATAFTATVDGITSLYDGVTVMLRNGVVTSASGFTININGLGAKPVYNNMATGNPVTPTNPTRDTTIFNINYTMLLVYDSNIVSGGGWICYRGYDGNTNTIGYQLRTNSGNLPSSDAGVRYRLWLTSADGTKWVPINTSTSSDATTARTLNTRPIDPFGPIVYNSTNGSVTSGSRPPVATLWQQYTLTIGYSYVLSMTAWKAVYLQCTPQTDGSAVMNALTQTLPSSKDGKIYIYLGLAYSATAMELRTEHPVYWHDGTGIRIWSGAEPSGGGSTQTTWYGTSRTSDSTTEKVVACEGFTLTKGAMISILFSTANTASTPKLNVNSTGAVAILIGNDTPSSLSNVLAWSPNAMLTFVYDGTYFRYISASASAYDNPPDGAGSWYGTSSTAETRSEKKSAINNYRPTPGTRVSITFSTANTYVDGSLRLNINNTGGRMIYVNNAATSASNTLTWDAGECLTFVYSGTYYCFVGRSKTPSGGSGGGGFLVTITDQYPNYVMDKTLGEIKEAVSNGICPTVYFAPENSYGTFAYMTPFGSSTRIAVFETSDSPEHYTAASDDAYPNRMGGGNN